MNLGAIDLADPPFSTDLPALAGRTQVTVTGAGGPLVVDLVTGASRRPRG